MATTLVCLAQAGCGPAVPVDSAEGSTGKTDTQPPPDSGPTGDPSAGSTSSTSASTSGGSAGSSASATAQPSTSSASSATTTDGSTTNATDYPVSPGCDEGDESFGEYPDSDGSTGASSGAEDTGIGMGDDFPLATDVFAIQEGQVFGGEFVELANVVVTTPATVTEDGGGLIFVQDPLGGERSGINLRAYPASQLNGLGPGDALTVRGQFVERYTFASITLDSFNHEIELTGTLTIPGPVVVTPDQIAAGQPLAEGLESVLVRVMSVQVTDPDTCINEVAVESALVVDGRFLEAEMIPIPPNGSYEAVTGPLIYTFNGFEVAPRSGADIEF